MGSIQSSVTKQTLNEYTREINTLVANSYNSSTLKCGASATLTIEVGVPPCPAGYTSITNTSITSGQNVSTNCSFTSDNEVTINAKFTNDVVNKTKQFIEQDLKNKQGWFSTAFSLQIAGAETTDQVTNIIKNSFTGDFTNICKADIESQANQKVLLCGYYDGDTFNFNQNALTTSITSCINRVVMDVFVKNSVLNSLVQQTDQKLASSQAGIFDGLFGSLDTIVIGIVIIVALIILLFIIRSFTSSSSKDSDDDDSMSDSVGTKT